MKKKVSQFEKWFKAQFGKLPIECRSYSNIYCDLTDAKKKLLELECEMKELETLESKFKAAQYSKNAYNNNFKFEK